MSSIDQAFVKAFARRTRPSRDVQPVAESSDSVDSLDEHLQVDPSVEKTAKIWIDPENDEVLRPDTPETFVPAPHHPAVKTPIRPAEHFRTDYVFGAIQEVLPELNDDADDVEVEPAAEPETVKPELAETEIEAVETKVEETEAVEIEVGEIETVAVAEMTEEVVDVQQYDLVETEEVDADEVVETTSEEEELAPEAEPAEAANSVVENAETAINEATPCIEPAWEVDAFDVPSTTADLFFDEDFFCGIANHMRGAVDDGLKSLVVTSAQSGEGRSTVAIGIAIAAAATGLKVALVDGDTETPSLAEDLRLDLESGWVDAFRSEMPLGQVVVQSIQDGVALFPLISDQQQDRGATAAEVQQLMETLEGQFDLVVVDGPSCAMPRIHQFAGLVDTALIARDPSRTDDGTINELSQRLQQSGVKGVGVVENFSQG